MYVERDPIAHIMPEGHDIIRKDEELREVISDFWDDPQPEDNVGGRFLGAGRYSRVYAVGSIAIKVSSPTSNERAYRTGEPYPPEDLTQQFKFLHNLGSHLEKGGSNIRTPRQYFALRSQHGAYMHGQELLAGWTSLSKWAPEYFLPESPDYHDFLLGLKDRISHAVGKSALRHGLNDMQTKRFVLHPGNVFVPEDAPLDVDIPLTIIDQPGLGRRVHERYAAERKATK